MTDEEIEIEMSIFEQKLIGGVHNDEYNLDFYDDWSIDVFNYKKGKTITSFDGETVKLLLLFIEEFEDKHHIMERIIYVIKKLATEKLDFERFWTLGQNNSWFVDGEEFSRSFRSWGGILADIDGEDDTDYLNYYCSYVVDKRTTYLQEELKKYGIFIEPFQMGVNDETKFNFNIISEIHQKLD